jgi:hypothetical protein
MGYRLTLFCATAAMLSAAACPAVGARASSVAPAYGASVLVAGETLTERGELASPSGEFIMFISEGDLILQQNIELGGTAGGVSEAVWDVNALANPPARYRNSTLTMQRNGNLVLRDRLGEVLWQTHTAGTGGHNRLVLRDSGRFQVRTGDDAVVWGSHTTGVLLAPGNSLRSGAYLRYRPRGTHRVTQLTMRRTGRLLLTVNGARVWRTPTAMPGSYLRMGRHGDLAIIGPNGERLWHTRTGGHVSGFLQLYDTTLLVHVVVPGPDIHLAFQAP